MNKLGFFLFTSFALGSANAKIYLHSVKATPNPAYVANFSASVRNDSKGVSLVEFSGNLKFELAKVYMFFTVMAKSNEFSYAYDRPILKGTIDECKANEGAVGNFVKKTVFSNLEKCSNIEFKCPRHAGFYYVKDFPIDADVPAIFNLAKSWELSFVAKARLQTKKPMVHIYTIVFIGGLN